MNKKVIDFSKALNSFSTVQEQNREYLVAVTEVQNRMITMNDLEMPPKEDFYKVPETYDEIAECYKEMKDICCKFTITLYSQLKNYPNQCIFVLGRIDESLAASMKRISFIQDNPDLSDDELEHEAKMLERYMDDIITAAEEEIHALGILLDNLNKFSKNEITRLDGLMGKVLDKVNLESADYEKARKELVACKVVLERSVAGQLRALYISAGAAIFALVAGTLTLGGGLISGNIALIFTTVLGFVMISGPLIYECINAIIAIREQDKLNDAMEKLNRFEADILLFSDWNDTVSQCKEQLTDVAKDLDTIIKAWSEVGDGFVKIKKHIKDSKGMLDAEEWSKIKTNLEACQKISEETKKMLESMKIEDTKFSKADLKIGMTKEELEAAVEQAEILTFEEYMLAI